jgi:hypothetical protein
MQTEGVLGAAGKMAQRNFTTLGKMCEEQGRNLGNVVGVPRELRQGYPDFPETADQQRVPAGFDEYRERPRRSGNQLQIVFFEPFEA